MTGAQGRMERMLESPRAQRRALAAGIAVLAIGTAVFVVAFFGDKAEPLPQANPNVPAQTVKPQIAVELDPQLRELAKTFIDTAVARKNLKAAFAITHADLKGSLTLKQWETGNIPVVPYPGADRAQVRYKVDYSYTDEALLEVGLIPPKDIDVKPLTFFIGFVKVGGSNGRWLVNYWNPRYKPPVPLGNG